MNESAAKEWWVYVIECSDGCLYTGIATDVSRRFEEHMQGPTAGGAKFFYSRKPKRIVFLMECEDRSHASQWEYAIKKLSAKSKRQLVASP